MLNGLTEGMTGGGIWNWLKNSVLSWILPAGLAGFGIDFINKRFGNDMPPALRGIMDTISGMWNSLINLVRGAVAKEELQADQGMRAKVDENRVFEEAAQKVGGTPDQQRALAGELREIVRTRISRDTGFSMSVDEDAAIASAIELRTAIHGRIVEHQNRIHPEKSRNPEHPERVPMEAIANRYATLISGADASEAAHINPNIAKGYLGMLFNTEKGVAADGEFQASQVSPFTVEVMAAASAAATPNATPAPQGAPAPAATGGRPAAAQTAR